MKNFIILLSIICVGYIASLGRAADGIVSVKGGNTQVGGAIQPSVVALTISSTNVTVDFSLGNHFSLTLTTNVYFVQPSNLAAMQEVIIDVRQDATGTRTVNFNTAYWKFPSGQILTTTTNASSWSIISGVVDQYATNVAVVQTMNFQ